jgi:hypothetical protein
MKGKRYCPFFVSKAKVGAHMAAMSLMLLGGGMHSLSCQSIFPFMLSSE